MTNLIRRGAVASLLVRGEARKQPVALRRLTKRPPGSPRGWGRNVGKAERSKRRDLSGAGEPGRSQSLHSTAAATCGEKGGKQNHPEGREAGSWRREDWMEPIRSGQYPRGLNTQQKPGTREVRAEGSIWTDRLVSALATASKEHIANAPSLRMGGSPVALPLRRRDTPDVETNDWRAVCGRTARTVRRAGRGYTPSRPLSSEGHKRDESGRITGSGFSYYV